MGKRHHFVPRFYLTAFRSAQRRIHIFNIRQNRLIADVSLRDQCYAHRLYGADNVVEDAFASLEGASATVLSQMVDGQMRPRPRTTEHDVLLNFIAFQLARTLAAQSSALRMSRLLSKTAFNGNPPTWANMTAEEAMTSMLAIAPTVAEALRDLAIALVEAPSGHCFITSDNPVFKYNMYCEGVSHCGVTGAKCTGLQVFLPLSPRVLLVLYDQAVYKVGTRRNIGHVGASNDDVASFNLLQLAGAQHNLYFNDASVGDWISKEVHGLSTIRANDRPRVNVAVDIMDTQSELLHQFWPMPNLAVRVSCISIRRNARRVPLLQRARQVRNPYATEVDENPANSGRRFLIKSRHSG